MQNSYQVIAVIVAGGYGKRMGKAKQFLKIAGCPMVEWSIRAFQKTKTVEGIILVVAKENFQKAKTLSRKYPKIIGIAEGGETRQESVKNGLEKVPGSAKIIVIHDGARPAVTPELIENSVKAAKKYGAAVVGIPVKDTIKKVDLWKHTVIKTVDRQQLWQAQTPQTFRANLIQKAYAKLKGAITDDAMLVEKSKFPVKMIMGSSKNFKVTFPEDLEIMDRILTARRRRA